MKIIDTSPIAPGIKFRPNKGALDFLQASYKELAKAMCVGISLSGQSIILYGCAKTLISGNNYSFDQGYIYDRKTDEIYYFIGSSSLQILQTPILKIVNYQDSPASSLFTDGGSRDVFNNRCVMVSDGAIDTGDLNYVDLVANGVSNLSLNKISANNDDTGFQDIPLFAGLTSNSLYGFSPQYRLNKLGLLHIQGVVFTNSGGASITNIGTLPYSISAQRQFVCVANRDVTGTATGSQGDRILVPVVIEKNGIIKIGTDSSNFLSGAKLFPSGTDTQAAIWLDSIPPFYVD